MVVSVFPLWANVLPRRQQPVIAAATVQEALDKQAVNAKSDAIATLKPQATAEVGADTEAPA